MRADDDRPDHTDHTDNPAPPVNNGIITTGGTHYVGNQAVGQGAQAISGTVDIGVLEPGRRARAADLLGLIERLLEEHGAELTEPEATATELRRLREELDEDEPQRPVLRRALDRLNGYVEPVTPLVDAVAKLAQAVQVTLGH